jgi:hypothetical protein
MYFVIILHWLFIQYCHVLAVCVTNNNCQNYWDFGFCPSSGLLETRKHDVSET